MGPGYEFMVELDVTSGDIEGAVKEIQNNASYFQIISRDYKDNKDAVPWFPVHIKDLDKFCQPDPVVRLGAGLGPPWVHRPSVQGQEEGVRRYCLPLQTWYPDSNGGLHPSGEGHLAHRLQQADHALQDACVLRAQPRVSTTGGELRIRSRQHTPAPSHLGVPQKCDWVPAKTCGRSPLLQGLLGRFSFQSLPLDAVHQALQPTKLHS